MKRSKPLELGLDSVVSEAAYTVVIIKTLVRKGILNQVDLDAMIHEHRRVVQMLQALSISMFMLINPVDATPEEFLEVLKETTLEDKTPLGVFGLAKESIDYLPMIAENERAMMREALTAIEVTTQEKINAQKEEG